jgi:hypothetical protein
MDIPWDRHKQRCQSYSISRTPPGFPHQKQYPLKPEVKEGLIPIMKDLKRQGLTIECSSPYNTPILSVRK